MFRLSTGILLSLACLGLVGCQTAGTPHASTIPGQGPAISVQQSSASDQFAFRVARTQPAPYLDELRVAGMRLYYLQIPLLSSGDLVTALPMKDRQGRPFVSFSLTEEGARKLETLTRQNIGQWLVFSVNDRVVALSPVVGVVTNGALEIGVGSEQEAITVASALRRTSVR